MKSSLLKKKIKQLEQQLRETEKIENERLGALIRKLYEQNKLSEIETAVKKFFEDVRNENSN